MSRPATDCFSGSYSPLMISFWLQQPHFDALRLGLDADEAEALRAEWLQVQAGARGVTGAPCLCYSVEKWPTAIRGGTGKHGDSGFNPVCLRIDLERAAEALPIRWKSTRAIYIIQGRGDEWRRMHTQAQRGQSLREQDSWPEPLGEDGRAHSRSLALAIMAHSLGWRGTCRWPRREAGELRRAA